VEFKFPVNWFKPPFTEFVLVSKEELSDDEWKIVFDPLVKKGVSDIEATIKSDTQFELLNKGSYGYESDDDDDYLPDSLRDEEIIEEVVEVPKPTFTPSENQKSLLKILNKAFNDRGWDETGLQPTRFQWIMDKAKFDGIARRRPQFRKLLASLRDANMITIEKYDGTHGIHALYSPIEMIEEKEDESLGRIKHTDKFEEFVAFNPSIFNAETLGDYTPEDLVMSSAIEGFQPMKYSVVSNAESDDYDKTYGKKQGAIRRRLKNKIMGQAIVGTKKGQWSARKSQELKRQYEEACEKKGLKAYKEKKTKKQKDLSKWSKQDWTTKSGKPSSKTGERYLPAKAIKALTDKEYKKTSDKKRKDSKKGKQFSDQPKKIADKVAKYRAETVSYEQMDSVINEIMKKIWRNFNMKTMRDDYNNVYERFLADKAGREREGYYLKTLGITRKTTSLSFNENMFPERDEDYHTEPTSDSLKEMKDFQEVLKNDNYDIILRLEGANDWKQQITMWLTIFVKPKKTKKYRAETFEAPMKGAQPPRRSQSADGVYLTREHTKAIKKALESQFPDTNWKVKKQGNSAVQFFGYSSPNENDPKRLEIDNIILKAIKNIENDDYGWEEGDDLGITIYDESTFMRFYEAESTKPHSVTISRSSNPEKKLMAVFEDSEGKKIKTTHFGQRGADDYTKHDKDIRDERKKLYLERHGGGTTTSTKEDWKDPTTAGALSRWILWNKPSLKASFDDYKSRFGLKGSIKVSKSAETNEAKFPTFQFAGSVLLVSLLPLFLDNRRDKV